MRGSAWFRDTLKASGEIDATGGVNLASNTTLKLNNVDQLARVTALEAAVTVLQGASGGGSSHIQHGHMNSFHQLADDVSMVIWGRDAGGHLTYMNGRFQLPLNPTHGQEITIYSHNAIDGGGDIILQYDYGTGQSWHTYNSSESDTYQANNQFSLQECGRRVYKVHYLVNGNLKEWHIRRVSHDISHAEIATIATNTAAIEKRKYSMYFHHDHSTHDYTTNGFQLPDGYIHYSLDYGDSTCTNSALTYGVCIRLPVNPVDHATVIIKNNNRYTTQNMQSIMFVRWNRPSGNVPGTRRLVEYGQPAVLASVGQNTVYMWSHATQKNHSELKYFAAQDIWMLTHYNIY